MSAVTGKTRTDQGGLGDLTSGGAKTLNKAKIAIRNLDFYYGSNKALKGINLDLPDRQVTGMIGPSGCGNSDLKTLNKAKIAIRNLDFYYGSNKALKGINLDLPDRQVTGMIGPSGCGK